MTRPHLVAAALAVLGCVLVLAESAWLTVGRVSPGASIATGLPTIAALESTAVSAYSTPQSAPSQSPARALALRAYRRSPVAVGALAVLAATSPASTRDHILTRIPSLSGRDLLANYLLLDQAARSGDVDLMALRADAALRAHPSSGETIIPALIEASGDSRFRVAVARRLALSPNWRAAFMRAFLPSPQGGATGYELLRAIQRNGGKLGEDEPALYFNNAVAVVPPRTLLAQWRTLDSRIPPPAVNNAVYDGTFKGLPGVPPFNWQLGLSDGVDVSISENALGIRIDADRLMTAARQMLVLPAGSHRLSFDLKAADDLPRSSIRVTLACAGGRLLLNENRQAQPALSKVAYTFTVPSDCRGQWLEFSGIRLLGEPGVAVIVKNVVIH